MKHPLKKLSLIFAFCFLQSAFCIAQNLVPNPSFEQYTVCPDNYYMLPTDWYTCSGDPDYYNACDTIGDSFGVPSNWAGYQKAADGNAYCGFASISFASVPYYKEYLGCQLLNSLIIGKKYYISFKVSFSFGLGIEMAANNIGLLFSTNSYQLYDPYTEPWNIPTTNFANIVDTNIISDSVNWTTIKGSIIANAAYQYILIGDFFDSSHTNIIKYSPYLNQQYTYYYIDEVCISEDSLTCNSTDVIAEINVVNDYINIYPNPASDEITIDISESHKNSNVIIYNPLGKKIINTSLTPSENTMNISSLYPGVYFIQINFNNKIFTKKIIKI